MAENLEYEIFDKGELKARELDNSRLFDVHRWSDHPEVNAFVDAVYAPHFHDRKTKIAKKHLKVLLLDLYISWLEDPERYTTIDRSPNAYNAKSRYNELYISRKTIDVVDVLVEAGMLDQEKGFFDRVTGIGRVTRVRPAPPLVELFKLAAFSQFDIAGHDDRLLVELRDRDLDGGVQRKVEYEPTPATEAMSAVLRRYNSLLRQTFIDVPSMGTKAEAAAGIGTGDWHPISQSRKTVVRVFNRGNFEFGGRFFGGWWESCPRGLRPFIFIDDRPTTEIDFSGFHIVLLYASLGISYWGRPDARSPYDLGIVAPFETEEATRAAVKLLVLVALNAKDKAEAFSAFRNKAETGSIEKRMKNIQIHRLLAAFEDRHPLIANQLCTDAGSRLMRLDSDITEIIIDHFTKKGVPVLTIHDSYIVPSGREDELLATMGAAFEQVMHVPFGRPDDGTKEVSERPQEMWDFLMTNWQPYEGYRLAAEERAFKQRVDPERSQRYSHTLSAFREWLKEREGQEGG